MLRHIVSALFAVAVGAASTSAVTDDLQCYKITNLNLKKLKGVVDLHAPSIGMAPGCKLGKVTLRKGVSTTTGKVKQQSPKPKAVLAKGTKVKLTLG